MPWGSCDHLGTSSKSFPAFGSSSSHQVPALQESSCISGQFWGAVIPFVAAWAALPGAAGAA